MATANLQDDAGGLKLKHDARGAPVGMDQKCLPHFRKQTLRMCYILLYNILVKIIFGWQPLKITGYAGFPHQFSTRFPRHCVHVQHGRWPQLSGPKDTNGVSEGSDVHFYKDLIVKDSGNFWNVLNM